MVEQGTPTNPSRVMLVRGGVKQATPFLDVTTLAKAGGEQGLLSLAFAPDYETSGHLYVFYTASTGCDSHGGCPCTSTSSPAAPALT